jgi:pilus assembly protein Flp/PilA
MQVQERVQRFFRDESAASALEYGLVVGVISLVIIAGLTLAGGALNHMFSSIGSTISSANAVAAA